MAVLAREWDCIGQHRDTQTDACEVATGILAPFAQFIIKDSLLKRGVAPREER